jgi:hypothetical protein
VDTTHPTRERSRALTAASLALALFWSGSSQARTQPEIDCADVAKQLQSLEIPAKSLAATPVDHVPVLTDAPVLAETVDADDMPTPLISLAPRAESALRDIFEDNDATAAEVVPAVAPSSPVAESEEIPDISELPDNVMPEAAGDDDIDLPMLQRRMFRIDI